MWTCRQVRRARGDSQACTEQVLPALSYCASSADTSEWTCVKFEVHRHMQSQGLESAMGNWSGTAHLVLIDPGIARAASNTEQGHLMLSRHHCELSCCHMPGALTNLVNTILTALLARRVQLLEPVDNSFARSAS